MGLWETTQPLLWATAEWPDTIPHLRHLSHLILPFPKLEVSQLPQASPRSAWLPSNISILKPEVKAICSQHSCLQFGKWETGSDSTLSVFYKMMPCKWCLSTINSSSDSQGHDSPLQSKTLSANGDKFREALPEQRNHDLLLKRLNCFHWFDQYRHCFHW